MPRSILTHGKSADCPQVRDGTWLRCRGHSVAMWDIPSHTEQFSDAGVVQHLRQGTDAEKPETLFASIACDGEHALLCLSGKGVRHMLVHLADAVSVELSERESECEWFFNFWRELSDLAERLP